MDRQNSGLGALLIVVLGAIALVVPLNLAQSAPPKPSTVSRSAAYSLPAGRYEPIEHSAEDLIADFLDADPGLLPEDGPWSRSDRQWPAAGQSWPQDRNGRDNRSLYQIEYLIVTLPDPLAPALSAQFDSRLDAIQRAAEADNFIIDRLDLPWPDAMKGAAEGLKPEQDIEPQPSPAAAGANGAASEKNRFDRDPGLILLRSRKERRLLILFIVGERPTTGIHKRALRSALDQTAWLSRWQSASEQTSDPFLSVMPPVAADTHSPELRIMGPTYSGSADSLAFTIKTWLDSSNLATKPRVRIISGSATAIGPRQFPSPIDYHMTTIPITANVFAKFAMSAFKAKPNEIALLSEANTAYGRSFGPGITNPRSTTEEGESVPTKTGPPILYLHFPLHIANLRGAWGAQSAIGRLPSPIQTSNIPLSPQPEAHPDYIVPPYSPRTSAADQLILSTLLSEIHSEHIGYIGLSASDVEDRMFLAQQIRRFCPDAVLVLFNTDLLYLHSDFNLDLRGTLLLSTYPLYNPEQLWTYPFGGHESRVPFSADNDEGVYNATLALLHDEGAMLEYSPPFSPRPNRPVLWLSLVGSDRLWPVTFRGPSKTAEGLFESQVPRPPAPAELLGVRYPAPLVMLFVLASALCLLFSSLALKHCGLRPEGRLDRMMRWVWRHEPLSAESFFETSFEGHAVDSGFSLLALERRLGVLSLALVTVGLYVIVSCFFFLPLSTALAGLHGVAPGAVTSAFALALAVTVLLFAAAAIWALARDIARSVRNVQGEFLKTLIRSTLPFAVSFLLLGYAYCASIFTWHRPAADEFAHDRVAALLLFFRAANLRDGVSPLSAILLVGGAGLVLLVCSVRRLNLLEQCQIRSGFLSFGTTEKSWLGVGELEHRLRERLEGAPIELPGGSLFALGGVMIVGWFLVIASGKSIDGRWFDFLVGFAALGVFAAQSWALLRLVYGWRALRRLLRRLYWHPTRVAYEEFQKHLPGGQRLKLTEPPPTTTALEYSLERVRQIVALLADSSSAEKARSADLGQELRADVKEVEDTVSNTLGAMARDDWSEAVWLRYQAERSLAHITRRVGVMVEPLWRLGDATRQPAEFEDKLSEQGSLFVVSRVVDLLRQVFPHFQNLALFVTASILMMLLAVSSYPFGHRDTLLWIAWLAVGSAVGAMLYVFVSMNRDRVLSLLQGTTPGQLTWNSTFIAQVVIYGLLPVLGLIGAQFPGQLNQAFSWISNLAGKS